MKISIIFQFGNIVFEPMAKISANIFVPGCRTASALIEFDSLMCTDDLQSLQLALFTSIIYKMGASEARGQPHEYKESIRKLKDHLDPLMLF